MWLQMGSGPSFMLCFILNVILILLFEQNIIEAKNDKNKSVYIVLYVLNDPKCFEIAVG